MSQTGPVLTDDQSQPQGGGGFGSLLRKALPNIMNAVQAVGGGIAAASGNPLPAEMVIRQRQFQQQQQEKEKLDQSVEDERQMRLTDLGLDIQRRREELRVNPPRSPQDLMAANLELYKKQQDIKKAAEEPKTFQTADGKLWYKSGPGQPSSPVMLPPQAPTNLGQVQPGAQGPLSPEEEAAAPKLPGQQAVGPLPRSVTGGGAETEYRDFASDPQFAGDPAAAARAFEDMRNQGRIDIKDPTEARENAKMELDGLQKEDTRIDAELKTLQEESQTAPKDQRALATQRMKDLRARKDVIRQRIDKSLKLDNGQERGPASSTIKTIDGQDASKIKAGQTVYDKQGQPHKVKSVDLKTGKITTE